MNMLGRAGHSFRRVDVKAFAAKATSKAKEPKPVDVGVPPQSNVKNNKPAKVTTTPSSHKEVYNRLAREKGLPQITWGMGD